jgi:hypothetical protein
MVNSKLGSTILYIAQIYSISEMIEGFCAVEEPHIFNVIQNTPKMTKSGM